MRATDLIGKRPGLPGSAAAAQTAAHKKRPQLIVHAGIHKTGTTSLQAFLLSETNELLERGILYPRTGIIWYGHHNLAWEIARDNRFVSSWGSINDLANEAAQFQGDVILSSEDFQAVIDQPERFAPLRFHPAFREHEFTIVLYVRNQAAYVESLYLEFLKHGLGDDFMAFVKPVLRDRKFRFRELTFHFDYARIYAQWAACNWANLVVRNYHQLTSDSTVADFCSVVCPDLLEKATGFVLKENTREELSVSLARFYANRVARALEPNEERAVAEVCEAAGGKRITMADDLRRVFREAFSESNEAFCSAAGLPKTGLEDMGNAPPGTIPIDSIFSFELLDLIASGRSDARALLESAIALHSRPGDSQVLNDNDLSGTSCLESQSHPNTVIDSPKISPSQKKCHLWQDATDYGNDWVGLGWFGLFNINCSPWIYHQTLGWIYPQGASTDSIWFYDPQWKGKGGWWWTNSSLFPWVFSALDGEWFYCDEKGSTPDERWFWNSKGCASH